MPYGSCGKCLRRGIEFKFNNIGKLMANLDCKWNLFNIQCFNIQFMNTTLRPENEMSSVGSPVEIGIWAKNCPGLLLVLAHIIKNGLFNACVQVTNIEY